MPSTREEHLRRAPEVMRDLMTWAVLFQDAVARAGGVNSTDMQTLGMLVSQGPATPGELADRVGITTGGAITAVLDRLERAGYVERTRDQQDRRKVVVTARMDAILERVGPIYGRVAARWSEYLETLDDDQLAFANELFARAAEINSEETRRLRSAVRPGRGGSPDAESSSGQD
ncbi:MarR family transcriptional regulator [Actinotalea ferrariae]|uniref:MarR family winged helix-turn-helix transcriptional regulator n=1 Tax=Actinotalea ferrariae TaxID=1386098 RepID=UPI001C8C70D3|nr:MarR family transcriptional regulator [Actinotalea ferrariae]MBX9246428.1 MarR family transcriptional regulator [Actinotalea ferrariae]